MSTKSKISRVQIGKIGVDAGCCWIGDPCYILHTDNMPRGVGRNWDEFCETILGSKFATQFNYDHGHAGLGVCVNTGGDGCFPVFAEVDSDGCVCSVTVQFMHDDDEEEVA